MKYTDDLKFALPEHSDNAEIEIINNNFRTVKAELKSVADKIIEVGENIVFGTYTGDGTEERIIELGFEPAAVEIYADNGEQNHNSGSASYNLVRGGLALKGYDCVYSVYYVNHFKTVTAISIVENGFKVSYGNAVTDNSSFGGSETNYPGRVYYFKVYKKGDIMVIK